MDDPGKAKVIQKSNDACLKIPTCQNRPHIQGSIQKSIGSLSMDFDYTTIIYQGTFIKCPDGSRRMDVSLKKFL
ncbi:MAG: hypothetical protein LUQ38_06960 [Methanotrichaceae archaeon]|nr:hypothetical protein [Methanotrichaceae archaeon]